MGCGPSSPPTAVQSSKKTKKIERQKQRATTIQEINSTMPPDPMNNKSLLKPAGKRKNLVFYKILATG